jgi:GNAT superfamily N-acetyltransferase
VTASTVKVRVLGPADSDAAADVLARGFDQEPAKLALLPDGWARRRVLLLAAHGRLYDAVRRGTAQAALADGELASVAVWVPPGIGQVSLAGGLRAAARGLANLPTLAPALVSTLRSDARALVRLARGRRRAVAAAARGQAWYLSLLATLPEHRGKGLARALLDRQLRRCDEDQAPAWLETTDPVNPPIYERFGFRTVARVDGPRWLPGLWVMRREPRRG